MDGNDAVTQPEIWHRRQVAAFWNVGLSTLDRWASRGHRRLPSPRFDPAGKPYWLAHEVRSVAVSPEPGTDPVPTAAKSSSGTATTASSAPDLTDEQALALLRQRRRSEG